MDTPEVKTEWEQSAEVADIFTALAKAQSEIKNAKKSSDNPFFKSKYADLAEVTEACRGPLTKNGIAVVQGPVSRGSQCGVRTMLTHNSGQWMACTALATPKDSGPQSYGSVVTYLRRYSLAGMAGVATEDDDGEKAEGRDKNAKPPGASWGAKERSAPKASGDRAGDSRAAAATSDARTTAAPTTDDPGEPINAATLEDLRFKATAKFPKGKAARDWLKSVTGIDDPAALSEFEGQRALKALDSVAA